MSDRKHLQGTWSITSLEMDGVKAPFAGGKIVIKGSRFTTLAMGGEYGGTMVFDETKTPKRFDLTFTEGTHQGKKALGIYELTGDDWKICMGLAGVRRRPKEFTTSAGSGFALETLKRGDAVPEAAPEEPAGPATELEGEWQMVSGSMDGHAMDPRLVKSGRRIGRGEQLTVMFGGQVYMKARITLGTSNLNAKKKSIDYALSTGALQLGIYELDGKRLTVCMAKPGDARPSDMKAGPGRTLTQWTKLK